MEVVQRTDDGPFGRRDVEEWSRLDELTGMLEHARVQTDRWAGVDAMGGSHKYGKKVVDATKKGDAGQHRQRQQLEVFQSRVPGGALQVIRSQSASSWSNQGPSRVTSTSSTTVSSSSTSSHSRWSTRSSAGGSTLQDTAIPSLEPSENFANLEMALNPIDVSSLKMKACVGRSGSIGGRRPPSTRSRRLSASSAMVEEEIHSTETEQQEIQESMGHRSQLSRLCQQVQEEQKRRFNLGDDMFQLGSSLSRRLSKSSSTDDIPAEIVARDENDEGMSSWRRGARVRRSLQFSSRDSERDCIVPVPATKRHSFITVESLKEVRGRLRHLTSDQVERSGKKHGVLKIPDYRRHDDENDDGIASEETAAESDSPINTICGSRLVDRINPSSTAPQAQTGSLESRSSRAAAAARSDEWFNRRKSYGFEQVHNQSTEREGSITEGKKTDSADSGISRSTETVPSNTWSETSKSNSNEDAAEEHVRTRKTVVTLNAMSNKWHGQDNSDTVSPTHRRFSESAAFFRSVTAEAQNAARRANAAPKPTTITIPIVFQKTQETEHSSERRRFSLRHIPDTSCVNTNGHSDSSTPDPETLGWASRRQLDGLGPVKRRSWAGDSSLLTQEKHTTNYYSDCDDKNNQIIKKSNTIISHELFNGGDNDIDDTASNFSSHKKTKRVEFCKTEVHFAAESGRFHIIETDEKPPPSNNFRRRRRSQPQAAATNTTPAVAQKPPLPELRFGDSMYEKKMLMASTSTDTKKESKEVTVPIKIEMEDSVEKGEEEHIYAMPNTTIVSGELSSEDSGRHTDSDDSRPRGILKKLSLDESENIDNGDREDSKLWGVRLRPVGRVEPMPTRTTTEPLVNSSTNVSQVWRSTVTLRDSNSEDSPTPTLNPMISSPGQMELQKLIRSLRPAQSQRRSLDLSSTPDIIHNSVIAQESVQSSSTWSVAERIRQHEDRKSRGFSTKVNLGGSGETTVLPHSESVWLGTDNNINASPTRRESSELRSETGGHINNNRSKPLVVRIGNNVTSKKDHETSISNLVNGYTSLITSDLNSTKAMSISIDQGGNLSPRFRPEAVRRASTGVLKSPSLIMQTIGRSHSPAKVEEPRGISLPELGIPGQLAALRQLYEAAGEDDDSDAADREVSALMSPEEPPQRRPVFSSSPCGGSVVSGSWSKMRAVRLSKQFHKYQPPETTPNKSPLPEITLNKPESIENDSVKSPINVNSTIQESIKVSNEMPSLLLRPVPRCRRKHLERAKKQDKSILTSEKGCEESMQVSAATFSVPSYNSEQGRLRAVDTLVSTRSGAPRITSISLRYEGDGEPATSSPSSSVSAMSPTIAAISPRRVSSPSKHSSPSTWNESHISPSKTVTSFTSARRSMSPISSRTVTTTYSSRLSPAKPTQDVSSPRQSPNKASLTSLNTTRSSISSSIVTSKTSTGLPPLGSTSTRRSVSPAGPRTPQVKVPITAPARRAPSPNQNNVGKKTGPTQTFFGAEVLEVEPRPEDRRGEDEIAGHRSGQSNNIQEVRRTVTSYRSSNKGRLTDYKSTDTSDSSRTRSLSPVKRLNTLATVDNPIYQNQAAISVSKLSPPPEPPVTSSAALIEELTRAADEILQAVNGYSDESPASSDDERPKARLSALREGEISRNDERTTPRKKIPTAATRLKKKTNGAMSSTSSVESVTREQRIPQRPALPGVRGASSVSTRPALAPPGSPARASSSDEGSGRKQRVLRRRTAVPATTKSELGKEEEERLKEKTESRNDRARNTRPRRPRTTSSRPAEEISSGKRVLGADMSKHRAPVERIIPAAPRKSPAKSRREEHHQMIRAANGATAERRLLLLESGSTTRGCGGTTSSSALGGRMKARGEPLKVSAK